MWIIYSLNYLLHHIGLMLAKCSYSGLLCLYGNREYPSSFHNKLVISSFEISGQVYSGPGQTEGRIKTFLEWKSTDLFYKLSLTCGDNVSYCKSVHHSIPTSENREHPGNFENKSVSSTFS